MAGCGYGDRVALGGGGVWGYCGGVTRDGNSTR